MTKLERGNDDNVYLYLQLSLLIQADPRSYISPENA